EWPGWGGLEDWLGMGLEDIFSDGTLGVETSQPPGQPEVQANQTGQAETQGGNATQTPAQPTPPETGPRLGVRSWPLLLAGLAGLALSAALAVYWGRRR
ncbi:MAG: hypothetical protein QI223_10260, partial [Candidatus Korarchaeota archaeon]|nr:hypothetical protein [Candidatus Korarchaeota archaeon]